MRSISSHTLLYTAVSTSELYKCHQQLKSVCFTTSRPVHKHHKLRCHISEKNGSSATAPQKLQNSLNNSVIFTKNSCMQAYSCTLILRMPALHLRDTEWGKGTKGTMNKETCVLCKNWGLHCGTAEDRGLLGCDTVSLGAQCFVSEDHSAFIYKIKQSKKNHSLWADSPWKWWHYYSVTQPNSHPQNHLDTCHFHQVVALLQTFTRTVNKITIALMPPYRDRTEKNWIPIGLNLWTIKL